VFDEEALTWTHKVGIIHAHCHPQENKLYFVIRRSNEYGDRIYEYDIDESRVTSLLKTREDFSAMKIDNNNIYVFERLYSHCANLITIDTQTKECKRFPISWNMSKSFLCSFMYKTEKLFAFHFVHNKQPCQEFHILNIGDTKYDYSDEHMLKHINYDVNYSVPDMMCDYVCMHIIDTSIIHKESGHWGGLESVSCIHPTHNTEHEDNSNTHRWQVNFY
jgi:hypothetical protein